MNNSAANYQLPTTNCLFRFTIRVPLEYVKEVRALYGEKGQKALLLNIRNRASYVLGLFDVKTTIQDPTNNELFTIIARQNTENGRPTTDDRIITLVKKEQVEEPPTAISHTIPELEPGLSSDEAFIVRYALLNEQNPRHLSGFASTFEPYFPITASLLRTKSLLLECRALRNRTKLWESNKNIGRIMERRFGQNVLKPCKINLADDLVNYTNRYCSNWQDVASGWNYFCQVMPKAEWYKWSDVLKPRSFESVENLYEQLQAWSLKSQIPMEALKLGIKRAICLFIDEPNLMFSAPTNDYDRKRLEKLPPQVINITKALLEEKGIGVWTINLEKYGSIFPPNANEGFVSPSALQLVLASSKPEWSGVRESQKIPRIFDDLLAPYNDQRRDALKARDQIERANRAIERRRWINWYQRYQRAYESHIG
jgi:hypothetical protein